MMRFSVVTLGRDGGLSSATQSDIDGTHSINFSGQDALITCGPQIYALVSEDSDVVVLELAADRSLIEVERVSIPAPTVTEGTRSLRALECVSGERSLVAVAVRTPMASDDDVVELHGIPRNNDGTLMPALPPVDVGVANGPVREVAIAWSPTNERGYVMYEVPAAADAPVADFTINGSGAALAGADAAAAGVLGLGVGAIEMTPAQGNLALVGVERNGAQGAGVGARLYLDPMDGTVDLSDVSLTQMPLDEPAWRNASSLMFASLGGEDYAFAAGNGKLIVANFLDVNGPVELLVLDFLGLGPAGVFTAHSGEFVVVANAAGVTARPSTQTLEDFMSADSVELPESIPAFSGAVLVPCPIR